MPNQEIPFSSYMPGIGAFERTASKDFIRDGVKYCFRTNTQRSLDATTDYHVKERQQHLDNKALLMTQAILAKVAFIFEDKVATDIHGEALPGSYAVYTKEDDPKANEVLDELAKLHSDFAKSMQPEQTEQVTIPYIPDLMGDTYVLQPEEAKQLLIAAAQACDYELPDVFLFGA